ncbi:M28 family metallopeptidase [Thalassotalea atypica]|uniref:M28 family metallopeptidase n=1 Tax=Thalassotalea atypica TaxID=2054316 RepID=UPI002573B338|nr:M28 family peptidase [Thalassotalea atypica]
MKKFSLKTAALIASMLGLNLHVNAAPISLESVKNDITYLASDELKGRASFTAELDVAASYIANRFKSIGLKPFKSHYLQQFPIYSFTPEKISLSLNGITISNEKLALASTAKQIHWTQDSDVNITYIKDNHDFRSTLKKLNQAGGDHLILIDPTHQPLFERYKAYFHNGLTKLNNSNQGSLLLAITNITELEQFSASGKTTIANKTLTNVVGVLPGKSKASEVILYSAHYDHLGTRIIEEQQDHVFNGADDNASGTTAIINLAQHFANTRDNERTLIFTAFTAEEIGGFGSKYFSQHIPADNITAMINIEMIGKASKFGPGKLWMTGSERSNLIDILNDSLRKNNEKIYADPYPQEQLFYRSDNATLARLGVPAHSFSTTQLDQDQHYHKASDEIETINLQSMTNVIKALALATKSLTQGSVTPTRIDTSKVRASGKIY